MRLNNYCCVSCWISQTWHWDLKSQTQKKYIFSDSTYIMPTKKGYSVKFSMMITLWREGVEKIFSISNTKINIKQVLYKGLGVRVILNFSTAAGSYKVIKQCLRISEGKWCPYPAKLSITCEVMLMVFSNIQDISRFTFLLPFSGKQLEGLRS